MTSSSFQENSQPERQPPTSGLTLTSHLHVITFASRALRCVHPKSIRDPRRTHEGLHDRAEQLWNATILKNTTQNETTPTHKRKTTFVPKRTCFYILIFSLTQNHVWGIWSNQLLISGFIWLPESPRLWKQTQQWKFTKKEFFLSLQQCRFLH